MAAKRVLRMAETTKLRAQALESSRPGSRAQPHRSSLCSWTTDPAASVCSGDTGVILTHQGGVKTPAMMDVCRRTVHQPCSHLSITQRALNVLPLSLLFPAHISFSILNCSWHTGIIQKAFAK